jgi:hypothetical protein
LAWTSFDHISQLDDARKAVQAVAGLLAEVNLIAKSVHVYSAVVSESDMLRLLQDYVETLSREDPKSLLMVRHLRLLLIGVLSTTRADGRRTALPQACLCHAQPRARVSPAAGAAVAVSHAERSGVR